MSTDQNEVPSYDKDAEEILDNPTVFPREQVATPPVDNETADGSQGEK